MEPTIYKPSIYKGAGIYKNGADGGGGGGGDVDVIGGRKYKVGVMPDGKMWLLENLDYKFIGLKVGDFYDEQTPCGVYYDNDEEEYGIDGHYKCGMMYNYFALAFLEQNKNYLLGNGWRVPSRSEWGNLISYSGGFYAGGTNLKSLNNVIDGNWPAGWSGDDTYNFFVTPSGTYSNGFHNFGINTGYGCVTSDDETGYYRYKFTSAVNIEEGVVAKRINGFYCRLIRDV